MNYKHGYHKTSEYRSWQHMKARCMNPNNHNYKYYGGRGIQVCSEWINSFSNFIDVVGLKPSPEYSLDRIDVNGNYEPNNVRWSDRDTQIKNRRNYKKNGK